MNVIFLDIDGVLNNEFFSNFLYECGVRDPLCRILDPICVKNFNTILKSTDAKVVVSSSWRKSKHLKDIIEILKRQGAELEDRCIGITPSVKTRFRGDEIQAWLDENSCEKFVIIDDGNDMGDLSERLVLTTWREGLTEPLAKDAISMLI